MAKYQIVVACGTNVTSTTVAEHLKEKLRERGITDVQTTCVRISEIFYMIDQLKPDLVVFSGNVPGKFSVPAFAGYPFLTGVGMDPAVDKIVDALKAKDAKQ